jgi:SGNH hydrolase-like domain, acetyltransferase AlgX
MRSTMLRRATGIALSIAGVAWLTAVASTLQDWADYRVRGLEWLLVPRLAVLLGGGWVVARVLRTLRAGDVLLGSIRTAHPLRAFVACFTGALLATSLVDAAGLLGDGSFVAPRCFSTAWLAGLVAWASWLTGRSDAGAREPVGVAAALDWLLTSGLVVLLAVEGGLAAWARTGRGGLLFDTRDAAQRIERWRLAPGQLWLGAPANSAGYPDDEFFVAGERDWVVALVADSFGVGVVPRPQHFATLLEERLRAERQHGRERIAVHNFSVSAIGMAEYRWLIESEVLRFAPSRVIVCVFTGNDVFDPVRERSRHSLRGWWAWKIPQRLWLIARSSSPAPPYVGLAEFDEESFLGIESGRTRVLDAHDASVAAAWTRFEADLGAIHERLGERLLTVVIPDELQVNDALWQRVSARAARAADLDRDLPQRRIAAFCDAHGIEYLDLLGPLRRAELGGATYRPRDTHWNERGNRVAADAIAARLLGPADAGSGR